MQNCGITNKLRNDTRDVEGSTGGATSATILPEADEIIRQDR